MMQLEWPDHGPSLSLAISSLYFSAVGDDQRLKDVTLAADGGGRLRAHKLVLAATSKFFKSVLSESGSECGSQFPIIYLRGVGFSELEALIQFIYSGKTKVEADRLNAFLELAHSLGVKGFAEENNLENPLRTDGKANAPRPWPLDSVSSLQPGVGVVFKHTSSEPAYPAGKPPNDASGRFINDDESDDGCADGGRKKRRKTRHVQAARSLDEMASPSKKNSDLASRAVRSKRVSSKSSAFSPTPKSPLSLSPLSLPSFWSDAPLASTGTPGTAEGEENTSGSNNNLFKKPFTPPPPVQKETQPLYANIGPGAKNPASSTVGGLVLPDRDRLSATLPKASSSSSKATETSSASNLSFDGASASPRLDPNELAAKGATLLHHLAVWMIEEKRTEEAEREREREREKQAGLGTMPGEGGQAKELRATMSEPIASSASMPGAAQTSRRSVSLLSCGGGDRPDSGFDSKDESSLVVAAPGAVASPSTRSSAATARLPLLESTTPSGKVGDTASPNSSPEEGAQALEMSRRAPIRQPVFRKRRMNFQ